MQDNVIDLCISCGLLNCILITTTLSLDIFSNQIRRTIVKYASLIKVIYCLFSFSTPL